MTTCPLCNLENTDSYYYIDDKIYIVDHGKVGIPLLVFRRHGADLPVEYYRHAEAKTREVFGDRFLYFRTFQSSMPNHKFWHIELRNHD